jgi:hypothetical protein
MIDRNNLNDFRKLLQRIGREVLKPQFERAGLEVKFSLLNKLGERQKARALYAREKLWVALGKGLEVKKMAVEVSI